MPRGNLRDLALLDPKTRAERAMVRRVLAGIELASAREELAAAERELEQMEAGDE
jgi:hypothetical protein